MVAAKSVMKEWAIFEQSGRLLCRPIDKDGAKSITVAEFGKIPRNRVWMIGDSDCSEMLAESVAAAAKLEIETVWRAAAGADLSAVELAMRVGQNGAAGALAVLQTALDNPAYFRRRNGMLCPSRVGDLEKARAALKRRQADREFEQHLVAQLAACVQWRRNAQTSSPPLIPQQVLDGRCAIIAGKEKNLALYRAVKKAADGEKNIVQFLIDIGVFASYRECMRALFKDDWPPADDDKSINMLLAPDSLPLADVPAAGAFSIDDASTFEIDDAFSAVPHPHGTRIGVHIALPALDANLFADSAINHSRLISVYFPDEKTPMLSAAHLDMFSLREKHSYPVLSLYAVFDKTNGALDEVETKLERVLIGGNYAPEQFDNGAPEAHAAQYRLLCACAEQLSLPEGRRHEFRIIADEPPRVLSRPRPPVSLMVEKLMRYVNMHWGRLLRTGGGGLFRAEGVLTCTPPTDSYAWTTSPLRRAVDLANQRLLLSLLGFVPPIKIDWRRLLRTFAAQQTKARHYQETSERYWVLQALAALPAATVLQSVRRDKNRVRLCDYPLSAAVIVPPKMHLPPPESAMSVCIHSVDSMGGRLLLRPAE